MASILGIDLDLDLFKENVYLSDQIKYLDIELLCT